MSSSKPFRHELKYAITYAEAEVLKSRFGVILQLDPNAGSGGYFIRSLYFDDLWETAYTEKSAGTDSRKKYRIRIYNGQQDVIRLECKRKEGQFIQKISASLSLQELEWMESGQYDFLKGREEPVCRQFYLDHSMRAMHPAILVDYDRIPYVYPYGDVRITLDQHVRAGVFERDIFDLQSPVFEVLEPGQLILEVKFTEYLPDVVRDLLRVDDSEYVAASKYVMCLEKKKELQVLQ